MLDWELTCLFWPSRQLCVLHAYQAFTLQPNPFLRVPAAQTVLVRAMEQIDACNAELAHTRWEIHLV